MATSNNEEIFLADSQGWKEEAQAVIKDVKEQVKDINISDKLQSDNSCIYLNITTVEDLKLTVQLSVQGFRVVSSNEHDQIIETEDDVEDDDNDEVTFYETPYSLLDSVSPGYREAFGNKLASQLRKLSEQNGVQQ